MAKKTKSSPKLKLKTSPSNKELPLVRTVSSCQKSWHSTIGRLRVYDQPGTVGKKVFVYVAPGKESNYVGYTDDPTMIKALFLARDNGNPVIGYTNASCRIEFLDY